MAEKPRTMIVGNWKMNGLRADGLALAQDVAAAQQLSGDVDLLICPPATLLAEVGTAIAGSAVALGAQDCAADACGAFTGDLSAEMLADVGCEFVILGHSERRQNHGETSELVARKVMAAQDCNLHTIVCVGETAAERDGGRALAVVREQIDLSLPQLCNSSTLVVAYEPVWAIGTGQTATPGQAQAMHAVIRAEIARIVGSAAEQMRVLYGGSMNAENAEMLLSEREIDGGLIGGASLEAKSFSSIVATAGTLATAE